jgi:hypothetical protein
MEPLICPQCGGKITEYRPSDITTVCGYCETKFVIEREPTKPLPPVEFDFEPARSSLSSQQIFVTAIACAAIIIGGVIFAAIALNKREKSDIPRVDYTRPTPAVSYSPPISPTPTPNLDLLEFGGKGTGEGLFQDAGSIAVDKSGRIYVGDDSLRVQQFDSEGNFLKLWQIPSETVNYKRARTIHKVAVDGEDNLFVAVGGVVLVYKQDADTPFLTLHDAPDYTVDFALRSDGSMLLMSNNDKIETLFFISKYRKITRSIKGFHSQAADASMSPFDVGLAAIRIAVDGAGNLYSIYAFGDVGSYQLSYNAEELRIFRFTPEGKYVNKFVETMDSVGIEIDNQSRIYITRNDSVEIYSGEGELLSTIPGLGRIDAFALDKQNNIYVLGNDRVIKRAAIE